MRRSRGDCYVGAERDGRDAGVLPPLDASPPRRLSRPRGLRECGENPLCRLADRAGQSAAQRGARPRPEGTRAGGLPQALRGIFRCQISIVISVGTPNSRRSRVVISSSLQCVSAGTRFGRRDRDGCAAGCEVPSQPSDG